MGKITLCFAPQRVFSLKNIIVYLFFLALTMGEGHCLPSHQGNILYTLLIAEMAAHRQLPEVALQHYLLAAHLTADPAVAEEATLLAVSLEAANEAVQSAELWAYKDPKNIQAQLIATTLLIGESTTAAIPYLKRAVDLDPLEVDQYILEIQERLSPNSAQNLKQALYQIATERVTDPYAYLLAAESAASQKDFNNAKNWVDSSLREKPGLTPAILLKARLISVEHSEAIAINFLATKLNQFPNDQELRFFYAEALMDNQKDEKAKKELSKLIEDKIFGGPALLLLAEISLKQKQWDIAYQTLQKAMRFPQSKDPAQYLLAQIDEQQKRPKEAIERYSNINPGPYHVAAILRAITLLKEVGAYQEALTILHNSVPSTQEEQKYLLLAEIELLNNLQETEDAMQLATDILTKVPNDEDVLYLRAITATKLQSWDIAEADLRKVIEQNPAHASALNALGYLLSFDQKRLPEAIYYATQALHSAPDNPVFIYTVGWTYYRSGNLQQAIFYLKKANDLSNDVNIAAHYGEVLWVDNQKEKAISIWKNVLKNNAQNKALLDTLNRLQVNLEEYP